MKRLIKYHDTHSFFVFHTHIVCSEVAFALVMPLINIYSVFITQLAIQLYSTGL